MKRLAFICLVFLFTLLLAVSCSNDEQGGNEEDASLILYPKILLDIYEEDTYEKDCIRCESYFCPPLDAIWQKEICIDECTDPPTIVLEGICEEKLECDPTTHILESDISCTTEDGYPGTKDKTCEKGLIYYTKCKTDCVPEECNGKDDDCNGVIDEGFENIEETCNNIDDNCNGIVDEGEWGDCEKLCGPGQNFCIAGVIVCIGPEPEEETCDGIDNNCDGNIDEGVSNACGTCGKIPEEICNGIDDNCDGEIDELQLNACGGCGPTPDEICNNIDDDCDGFVDEDLVQECSTVCEKDLEYCISGSWICTAKEPLQEICNGLDDDCDGSVDENLDCLCTVQDINTLIPCKEKPLICGEGFKTCECKNSDCTSLGLTECLAVCHWLPQTLAPGETCDKYKGIIKPEECNNHDDNCNQAIDEGLTKKCYDGPASTVYVGICLPGEMFCENGAWGAYTPNGDFMNKLCLGQVLPEEEDICNGSDSNCDGKIDEDKQLEPTDILFIVDLSGSMMDEINAVTVALNTFATHYSDADVLQWGLVTVAVSDPWKWANEMMILNLNLTNFQTFVSSFATNTFQTNGSQEMIYDALYMSIWNLVGLPNLPYQISDLKWWPGGWNGTPDSYPSLDQWKINWRDDAKHVIIVFTDENGQSFLNPTIDEPVLIDMISVTDDLSIYVFNLDWIKQGYPGNSLEALTQAGVSGKYFSLTDKAIEMYNHLLEILEETACENKDLGGEAVP